MNEERTAEIDAGVQRAIRTLLPGLSVARYSERWSPESPAVQAFDILAEWVERDPYPDAENDAREAHVTTEYARSRGMVTIAECDAACAEAWERGHYAGREYQKRLLTWAAPLGMGVRPAEPVNPYARVIPSVVGETP